MTIALIIPAYNAADSLDATLAAVAAQTVLPDEVVIGDDASTDATAAVAAAWAPRLPIKVVTCVRNGGPAAARNAAIAASTSELIAILDADDLILPDHLAALLAAYRSSDDGLAVSNGTTWIPGVALGPSWQSETAPLPPRDQQLAWLLEQNRVWAACLFSRARFTRVGGFREQFFGTEDWDLWIRMVRDGAAMVRAEAPTFLYRLNRDSVSSADGLVDAKLAVLDAAQREGGPDEAAAIKRGRRRLLAAQQLNRAYGLAADGHGLRARIAGVRATRGIRSVAIRGAAMALAPTRVAKRRDAVRFDTSVWMKRYGNKRA